MSTETLVKVSDEDVYVAYTNFREIFDPKYSARELLGNHFWRFVGLPKLADVEGLNGYWFMPERAAHYVNLLKGPHYKTIAKAMVLNGHQYKEPLK